MTLSMCPAAMPLKVKQFFLKPKATRVSEEERDAMVSKINSLAANWKQRLKAWRKPSGKEKITLISDCAGYGSDLVALRLLGLHGRIKCLMTSECNAGKRLLHQAVAHKCGFDMRETREITDMCSRDPASSPRSELYVAGFPCPSFSKLGRHAGTLDSRGMVTLRGLEFISTTRPRVVVLEQVSSLLNKKHKKVWDFILKILARLNYEVIFQVLNTRHYGIAQSRPRVYVVAVAQECCNKKELKMPPARDHHPDLHYFLDKQEVGFEKLELPHYEKQVGPSLWTKGYIVDVKASEQFQHAMANVCPCLTFSRCREQGYYIPKLRRRLSSQEMARFQGLPDVVHQALLDCAKEYKLPSGTVEASMGDAMSVNILMLVLRLAMDASGLASLGSHRDYWLRCPSEKCFSLSNNLFAKN